MQKCQNCDRNISRRKVCGKCGFSACSMCNSNSTCSSCHSGQMKEVQV